MPEAPPDPRDKIIAGLIDVLTRILEYRDAEGARQHLDVVKDMYLKLVVENDR